MKTNDRIIIDQVLEQRRLEIAPSLDQTTFFEIFSAEQILKDYDLSYDEIESGIIGGGGDGGIDGFYLFVNGELVQEDTEISDIRKNITIELVLIQSKTGTGFSEAAMDRFEVTIEDIFDLSVPIAKLSTTYRKELMDATERFRRTYQGLASKFPQLKVRIYYTTKGDEVHPNVERKRDRIQKVIRKLFSSAESSITFIGARELLDLARREPTNSYELKLAENPISSTGDGAFICLVSLKDFHNFITDNKGHLIRHIFEANVRDYQGKTQVNEQIQETLQQQGREDFWWMNNGITVLANRASQSGKTLTIENPEIVNGLQTSTEIHSFFSSRSPENEVRNVLVRIIVPNAPESRDRIIKATNSQTAIPPASLRATDRIHRDIEQYLRPFGIFYDRRKNFYKNEGRQISRIVSIQQMAQAVMAIVLNRPDSARARPSSLLKSDTDYKKIFSQEYPIALYRVCAEVLKQIETYLASHSEELSITDKNNLKFYVAMVVIKITLFSSETKAETISELAGNDIEDRNLDKAYRLVKELYIKNGSSDQAAKGTTLLTDLMSELKVEYPKKKKLIKRIKNR